MFPAGVIVVFCLLFVIGSLVKPGCLRDLEGF
ncbi:hypothetical protein JL09_g5685 [Pichia kudriavzevii]|uniref:Uncharacterized protein n=1 Tax=Pichia kudriavzevii TaxID=4909 RepID=A0A099NRH1_PICKU|nr:hypothetical protein JL09_g5685 [Pichia kudriavzevii]